jgi:hypothetical protein
VFDLLGPVIQAATLTDDDTMGFSTIGGAPVGP